MMRQAGRYMSEYQAVRRKVTFLELCKSPELACEVTLQPIDAFGFDAAILFSDILVLLEAMGLKLEFTEAGPKLPEPIATAGDVAALAVPDPTDSTQYVMDAVATIRKALAERVPLIGFAGAPFTLFTYAVEGGGSKSYAKTKGMMFQEPALAHELLDKIARSCALYLEAQVVAGAQALQLFDSWAGILAPPDFREFALQYATQVIGHLKSSAVVQQADIPIIYFVNGVAPYLDVVAESRADVFGIDWRVDLGVARSRLGRTFPVQGNLDPTALFLPEAGLRERIRTVLDAAGPEPGHVFNLGHGILPMTDRARVKFAVEAVRELSSAS